MVYYHFWLGSPRFEFYMLFSSGLYFVIRLLSNISLCVLSFFCRIGQMVKRGLSGEVQYARCLLIGSFRSCGSLICCL